MTSSPSLPLFRLFLIESIGLIICVGGRVRDRNFIFRVDEKDVEKNCQEISRVQREGIEKCFFRRRECASIVERIFSLKSRFFE